MSWESKDVKIKRSFKSLVIELRKVNENEPSQVKGNKEIRDREEMYQPIKTWAMILSGWIPTKNKTMLAEEM